jgi:[ribosomal protein S5]-alanine N-acetyltransferase
MLVMQRPPNIESKRLLLVALLPEEMEALIARDFERFSALSGLSFPPDNPDIGDLGWHLRAIQADNKHLPWRMRVIVERTSKTVVGSINFKGPPNAAGDVEIGWGLIENVRGRGYATEASAAVIKWGSTAARCQLDQRHHTGRQLSFPAAGQKAGADSHERDASRFASLEI